MYINLYNSLLRYDLVASDISGYVSENELRFVLDKVRSSGRDKWVGFIFFTSLGGGGEGGLVSGVLNT
jgi:hypothetical protein